jgi:DNA-binding transcriptional ArsR family regulator
MGARRPAPAGDADLSAFLREVDALEEELARWAWVLAHPVRDAIVEALSRHSPRPARELAAIIDTSRSTLDRSLRRLLERDVIVRRGDGRGYELRRSR